MENQTEKPLRHWLIPLQAFPAVLLLLLLSPLPFFDQYGKTLAALQLLVSCATIPLIISFKDVSFRIWACGALMIPLPLLIFMQRISFEPFLLTGYYQFLILFFLLNYYLRNLSIYIPLLIVSFFGSILIWGITEMFSPIENEHFFLMSPVLNFFLNREGSFVEPIIFLLIVSFFGYGVLIFDKFKKKELI